MKHYKHDRHGGLVDEAGKQILVIVPTNCSKSFAATCYKLLAEKLNTIERGKGFSKPQEPKQ